MRLKHIDILRGLAALMVTIFHISVGSLHSKQIAGYAKYGFTGVEIFFVISGFVLPYSLYKSNYQIQHFFKFILKRIIRIVPAYFITIIISSLLAYTTGRAIMSITGISLHLVFLNSVFGYDNISPVFWTLQIEFVFYIIIGLLFTYILLSNNKTLAFVYLIIAINLYNPNLPVINWLPFFAMGILIFNLMFTKLNAYVFWGTCLVLTFINIKTHDIAEAVAALFAVIFILYAKLEYFPVFLGRFLLWLGMISYSLYLIHWEMGRTAVSFTRHIHLISNMDYLRLLIGVLVSICSAYLLYRVIEKPSIQAARKIEY